MYELELVRAGSVDEAVKAVADTEDAKYLGGGQTLLPTMKQRLASPPKLVSLTCVREMQGVQREGGELTIGGATVHARVARDAQSDFPGLASLAGRIGDPAVRNRGTIGGSLANNDPAACYPAAVLACGATILTNAREILADDYFQGTFTTNLEEGELITGVRFPLPSASNYQKFIQPASRFAMVGVFVARYRDRVGVAITGASEDGVFRWTEAEQRLADRFEPEEAHALSIPSETMIEDIFGSREYRAHMIPVLTGRAVEAMRLE